MAKVKLKKDSYKLIDTFKTSKKEYKKGNSIRLTKKGAEYLRLIKKIK